MASDLNKPDDHFQGTEALLHSMRELLRGARQKVKRMRMTNYTVRECGVRF
jgi:hypothetical protein